MSEAVIDVDVTFETKWAVRWVRLAALLRFVVGHSLAGRLATWGAYRLIRYRIGSGRLRSLPR